MLVYRHVSSLLGNPPMHQHSNLYVCGLVDFRSSTKWGLLSVNHKTMSWTEVWSLFRYFLFTSVLWVCSLRARVRVRQTCGQLGFARPFPGFSFQHPRLCSTAAFHQLFSDFLGNKTGIFHMCLHLPEKVLNIVPSPLLQANAHRPQPLRESVCSSLHPTRLQVTAVSMSRFYRCFLLGLSSGDLVL